MPDEQDGRKVSRAYRDTALTWLIWRSGCSGTSAPPTHATTASRCSNSMRYQGLGDTADVQDSARGHRVPALQQPAGTRAYSAP